MELSLLADVSVILALSFDVYCVCLPVEERMTFTPCNPQMAKSIRSKRRRRMRSVKRKIFEPKVLASLKVAIKNDVLSNPDVEMKDTCTGELNILSLCSLTLILILSQH